MLREIGSPGRLHKPHVEQTGFALLKDSDIPSVLVEAVFISKPEGEFSRRSPACRAWRPPRPRSRPPAGAPRHGPAAAARGRP